MEQRTTPSKKRKLEEDSTTPFNARTKKQQKILDPECIPLILKSDCPTRWNNKYLVWERILKLRKPLINTLMEAQSWPSAKNTSI